MSHVDFAGGLPVELARAKVVVNMEKCSAPEHPKLRYIGLHAEYLLIRGCHLQRTVRAAYIDLRGVRGHEGPMIMTQNRCRK